jgi:hypothetical protein
MKKLQLWTCGFAVDEIFTIFVHLVSLCLTGAVLVGCAEIGIVTKSQAGVVVYGVLATVFLLIPFGILIAIYLWRDSRDFLVWPAMVFCILCGPSAVVFGCSQLQNPSNANLTLAGQVMIGVSVGMYGLCEILIILNSFFWPFDLVGRHCLTLTNNFRRQQGLRPLRWSQALANCGRWHSFMMAIGRRGFGHDAFESRAKNYPFKKTNAAENVAWNEGAKDVAKMAVDGWINSPGHRKNMLADNDLCGISCWRNLKGQWYFTQLFAKRG